MLLLLLSIELNLQTVHALEAHGMVDIRCLASPSWPPVQRERGELAIQQACFGQWQVLTASSNPGSV